MVIPDCISAMETRQFRNRENGNIKRERRFLLMTLPSKYLPNLHLSNNLSSKENGN